MWLCKKQLLKKSSRKQNKLPCIELCKCEGGEDCENNEILHGIIEDTDSDSDCDSGNYQSRFQNSETFNV